MNAGTLFTFQESLGGLYGGTFVQSGGSNTMENTLSIGDSSNDIGTYRLSGTGFLGDGLLFLGASGTGTFLQSGGTQSVLEIEIGSHGIYSLTAGTLNLNGGICNKGIFDLSNSTAMINASSSLLDLCNATLSHSENVSLSLDSHSLLIVPIGFDPASYFKKYSNSGLLHYAGTPLTISSTDSLSIVGEITDHVYCLGTLTGTINGLSVNLNNGLNVSDSGNVDLLYGSLYVNDSISSITGGLLHANSLYVGSAGTGTFTYAGGSSTLGVVYLGYGEMDSGICNLSGTANLTGSEQYIGYSGTGKFTQSSGTNTANYLCLGYNATGSGAYELSGAASLILSVSGPEYIGYSGIGTFSHSSGSHSCDTLYLGYNDTSNGIYELSGTGNLISNAEYVGYLGTGAFTQSGGTNMPNSSKLAQRGLIDLAQEL